MLRDGQTRRSSQALFVTMRTRLKQTVTTAAAAADDDEKKHRWRDSSNRNTKEYCRLVADIAFPSSMRELNV